MQSSDDSSVLELEMLPSTAESSIHAANEVAARLRVDVRTGLTWSEAKYRAKIIGYNELNATEDDPTWKKYFQQFQNPLILLLLGESLQIILVNYASYTFYINHWNDIMKNASQPIWIDSLLCV